MDPYDAIVEQLEGAQEQGLKTIRDRLEAILENLDQVSSSIREAMPEHGDEVFPVGDLATTVAEMRRAAEAAVVVTPPPAVTLERLRELDGAESQSDLLRGLLGALGDHAARAVVLVFRPDDVNAWSAIGFGDASELEQWSCAKTDSPIFEEFIDDPRPRGFRPADDPVFERWLTGASEPVEALLVPVSLRGKTMGAVYADRLEGAPWDPEAIQVLVAISCWMIDTLKYRSASTSPMLDDISGLTPAVEGVDATVAESVSGDAGSGEAEQDEGLVEDTSPASAALDEMAAEADFDPSATLQVEDDGSGDEPAAEVETEVKFEPALGTGDEADEENRVEAVVDTGGPGADEVAAEEETDWVSEGRETSDAQIPGPAIDDEPAEAEFEGAVPIPPPVEPVVPPPDVSESEVADDAEPSTLSAEDESRHEEARRFARLLVSEIKLYNEDAVDRGRQQNDLYARLREDIDRSREMYEKRISPDIRTVRDYFHEELVRILADGDAGALGM